MNIREIQQARAKVAREIARLTEATETLRAQEIQLAAMEAELKHRLHFVEHRSTVNGAMESLTDAHRVNISAGRGGSDPFLVAIRAKGYTLRSLAKKLDVSASMLSMNRRTHGVPVARAKAIEALTGWPADRKHWPAGILS